MASIEKLVDGIFRICNLSKEFPVSFNQYLIDDERPALIHTGMYPMYESVRKAIAEVMDPSRLEYVVVPHFEADECGGMGRFVSEAPNSKLVCSQVGAMINLTQWDYSGQVQGVREDDVIDLGNHKLRFLETPHVHHWDSMMIVEEKTKSLFPADLFIQTEDQPSIVQEDLSKEMCAFYREIGIFASEQPVRQVVDRIEKLDPDWIHPMHGGSLPKDMMPNYVQALREERFAFEGKLFGRMLPS